MTKIKLAILGAFALFLSACSAAVSAAPGWYFEPARDGHGLMISSDTGFGHGVTWFLYREDGSAAFLAAGENCPAFPCVVPLHEPTANFMGGALDLGEPVGSIELHYTGGGFSAFYDLRAWRPDRCFGVSPGGIIFNRCAGRIDFTRLAD